MSSNWCSLACLEFMYSNQCSVMTVRKLPMCLNRYSIYCFVYNWSKNHWKPDVFSGSGGLLQFYPKRTLTCGFSHLVLRHLTGMTTQNREAISTSGDPQILRFPDAETWLRQLESMLVQNQSAKIENLKLFFIRECINNMDQGRNPPKVAIFVSDHAIPLKYLRLITFAMSQKLESGPRFGMDPRSSQGSRQLDRSRLRG